MAEVIFEIFCEEIPARMQLSAAKQLQQKFEDKMQEHNLFFTKAKSYVTPRRLALTADGLSLTQEDTVMERKGPRTDAPEAAIDGFIRSTGLKKDQLTIKSSPKGDFYFAIIHQKGKPTKEILRGIFEEILETFSWPKSMRWGENRIRWVRPIKSIACVFGGETLQLKFGHIISGNKTFGHRFLGKNEVTVSNIESYQKDLDKNFVTVDNLKRKEFIQEKSLEIANDNALDIIADEYLLDEVTGLVEYPNIMLGSIDKKFMNLPEEVLITSIKIHQKYFCLRDKKGKLAPYFIFVSNMKTSDGGAKIIDGNQRVLKARLSDAEFFFNIDTQKPLEKFLPKLKNVVFHAKVGSMHERALRIEKLAVELAKIISPEKEEQVKKAAKICKADLVTEMVGEFPELQGVMGYYYALNEKQPEEIALAIKGQYSPLGPSDKVPEKDVPAIIALTEKIEGLTSLFAAGERATGSKDPFALRRLALGIIRIVLENRINLNLKNKIFKTIKMLPSSLLKSLDKDELNEEICNFITERLKHLLKKEEINQDIIAAILGNVEDLNIVDSLEKMRSLSEFLESKNGSEALEAYKRAANILQIEEKKQKTTFNSKVSKGILSEGAEKILFEELSDANDNIKNHLKKNDFEKSLKVLSRLSPYINNFYDNVLINIDDEKIRENRLKLSAYLCEVFNKVSSFELL